MRRRPAARRRRRQRPPQALAGQAGCHHVRRCRRRALWL
eukprot:SM011620S25674  [mRNA]  locus=s11620:171:415:- [translate_table: standard]